MKIMQAHNYFSADIPFESFYVNSCGYFYDIDIRTKTDRPDGREDFQLICVTAGCLKVKQRGKYCVFEKGSALLFKPGQPQIYKCSKSDNSAYFWIHFGGASAQNMLERCGFKDTFSISSAFNEADIHLIQQMITEINLKPTGYQIKLLSLFSELLAQILRHSQSSRNESMYQRLAPALSAMERDIQKAYSIKEYADICNMSMYHFSHCFKSYTGQSPMQYRDAIAMNHSAYLLADTGLPVSEISAMVGFSDPLYFSKKFKKKFGVSPSEYRKLG